MAKKGTAEAKLRVERVQTGVRMEKRLVKVLKGLAEVLDMTLGDLLEGIVLHAFEGKAPFGAKSLRSIEQLKDVYGLDLDAGSSHRLVEAAAPPQSGDGTAPNFEARRIDCEGSFLLDLEPDRAFPLFTPLGEMGWVEGWDPDFLHPSSGELEVDQVFVTGGGGATTLWTVVDQDPDRRRAAYLRVTPGSRLGRVAVQVDGEGLGSRISVRYVLTGLSPEGNAELEAFEAGYGAMLDQWRIAIERYLAA